MGYLARRITRGGRSGGATRDNHARASGVGASRRSGIRRRNGRCGGGVGGGDGGGGASAAAKTSGLGNDYKRPEDLLETARREATDNGIQIKEGRGDPPSPHRRGSRLSQ